jgi:hypothetical protein
MENQEYYSFTPGSQVATRPKIKRDNHLIKGITFLTLALVLICGAIAAAYFTKSWPFSGIGAAQLFEQAMEKIKTIDSAYYDFSIEIKSVAKQTDALPFKFDDPNYQTSLAVYQKDNARLNNARDIVDQLKAYKTSKKSYPKTLEEAEITIQDPTGQTYQYASTGKTFSLKIAFDTDGVIEKLSGKYYGIAINGKEATFNELSLIPSGTVQAPKPLLLTIYNALSGVASWVPNNFSLSGKISGNIDRKANSGSNAMFKIGGNLTLEDLIINAEVESIKSGQDVYVRINTIPGIPGINLSDLKQKWIKINPDDLDSFSSYYSLPSQASTSQEELQSAQVQFKTILQTAQEEQLITLKGEPQKEILEKEKVYHYQLELNKEKIATFYAKLADELKNQYQDQALFKFNQKTAEEFNSSTTLALIDYINKNISIDLFISRKTGYPVKGSITLSMIPPADSEKTNQIVLSSTLNLSNINKEIIIDVPKEFIGVEDASLIIQGISKEEYLFKTQKQNITNVRNAIYYFRGLAGKFPESLDQLTLARGEIKKLNTAGSSATSTLSDNLQLLQNVPNDVFTNQAFIYSKTTDDNYKLNYQMILPSYQKGKKILSGIYRTDGTGSNFLLSLNIVSGTNTSDKINISLEAKDQRKIDSDKDKLTDSLEIYIGTDPKDKDTDKDGYMDGEDLKSGYDPLSSGMLQQ